MSLSQKQIAQKRARKNLKRKGKRYTPGAQLVKPAPAPTTVKATDSDTLVL